MTARFLKPLGFAAATAVAFSSLAACSGTTESTGDSGSANVSADTTLVYGAPAAATASTDPHGALFGEADWLRLHAIYDTLIGQDDAGQPKSAIATTWEPNEDATEWTLTLDPKAKFSDDSPVTSADVKYTLTRIVSKAAENGNRAGSLKADDIGTPDDKTVVLPMAEPTADLPTMLANLVFVVKDGAEDFAEPLGAGPYKLDKLDGTAATLSANPHWYGGEPGVSSLEVRGFTDPSAMTSAITTGAIDVASNVQPVAANQAKEDDKLSVTTVAGSQAAPLLMRVDTAPFDNPKVREALKLAVDRQALIDTVYLGYGDAASDMMSLDGPAVPQGTTPPARDVAKAKELLKEAGVAEGEKITLNTTSAYPEMVPAATLVKEQLAEAGLEVDIKEHDPQKYWTEVYATEPFTVGYWSQTTFPVKLRQTALTTSPFSETGWKKADFDKSFNEAMAITESAARNDALGKLHTEMAADGGWLVWGFGQRINVAKDDVTNVPTGKNQYRLSGVTKEAK